MRESTTPERGSDVFALPKAIVAMARNRAIGHQGQIPWHLPEDLAFVKQMTLRHDLLMGRRTWDSLGGKPLPQRRHFVVTRSPTPLPGAVLVNDLACLNHLRGETERVLWLFGGAELYRLLLPCCSDLFLTIVDAEPEADTFMPEFEDRFRRVKTIASGKSHTIQHLVNFNPVKPPWDIDVLP